MEAATSATSPASASNKKSHSSNPRRRRNVPTNFTKKSIEPSLKANRATLDISYLILLIIIIKIDILSFIFLCLIDYDHFIIC